MGPPCVSRCVTSASHSPDAATQADAPDAGPAQFDVKYCCWCYCDLRGLTEHRCPKCSRAFDPADPLTYSKRPGPDRFAQILRLLAHPIIMIPLVWAASIPSMGLSSPVVVLGALANLVRRRWISAALIVACTPLTVTMLGGVAEYKAGTARLRTMGLPGLEFWSVDRGYRCEWMTGGCLSDGSEELRDGPYNTAVMLMIQLFGPMPGSYTGPYPTREEARAAVEEGTEVLVADLMNDTIRISPEVVRLDDGLGEQLVGGTSWGYAAKYRDDVSTTRDRYGPIRAALVDAQCLVLRIPTMCYSFDTKEPASITVLIDCDVGRPFAYYEFGETGIRSRPRWTK